MSDVRDWGQFIRGRWDWKRYGYEAGLPRRCGFGDIDAALELGGRHLIIEAKSWDGEGARPELSFGQGTALRHLADEKRTVWVLWGCAGCNNPLAVQSLNSGAEHDWRELPLGERRSEMKRLIDDWAKWADAADQLRIPL